MCINRITPLSYKTDWATMNRDMANGASKQQIYTNINNGKYDVPDKKYIRWKITRNDLTSFLERI